MEKIKYIVCYDVADNLEENRANVLASSNKIDYIVSVLNDIGYKVDLISISQTLNNHCYKGKEIAVGMNSLHLFPTTWRGGLVKKIINTIVMRLCIRKYLRDNIKPNEKVIVYHSFATLWILNYLKKKSAFVIEEVEELFGEILGKEWLTVIEKKRFKIADAYIFPSRILEKIVNINNKPYIVVHGAYINTNYGRRAQGGSIITSEENAVFEKDLYHVAYTGILDPKKGCLSIVEAGKFLNENYHIHILGFGSESEMKVLSECIDDVSSKTECIISYDGIRRGAAYEQYLRHLNLGVCPADSSQTFLLSQFPSKIISYMTNGVMVLCSDIESVKNSDVADGILFYSGNRPEDIANAIINAKEKNVGKKRKLDCFIMQKCDMKFRYEIKYLLEGKYDESR